MIFVDSNVPMYVTGGKHPNKHAARAMLERLARAGESLVTSAEVVQEILHRYVAIDRRDAIGPTTRLLIEIVREVLPIDLDDVLQARDLVLDTDLSSRDALHVAVMRRAGISTIATFDRDFDMVPGIERLSA